MKTRTSLVMKRFLALDAELKEAVFAVAKVAAKTKPASQTRQPRALLVGGCVRDLILGLSPKDVDIELFGLHAEEVEAMSRGLFGERVDVIGKSFGVIKIFLGQDKELDLSLPRRESKTGRGHTGFFIDSDPLLSFEDAAQRRDFTINAISFDPLTGGLIDPFRGQDDLHARLLRVVDADHFGEDPLRVYRAVQFVARFGLTVDPATQDLMHLMVSRGDLDELSPERIGEEIKKLLLKAPKPSVGFSLARDLGLIRRDYPELDALTKTIQEPEWHPEGDVWIHTLMVIDAAAAIIRRDAAMLAKEDQWHVMLGALCHDLGKPSTTAPGEKHGIPRIRSIGHETAGEEPVRRLLEKWAFGETAVHAAIMVTTQHMLPNDYYKRLVSGHVTDAQYANAVRKLIRRIHPMSWLAFLDATEADWRGRSLPHVATDPYEQGLVFAKTVKKLALVEQATHPLIQGRDIIRMAKKLGIQLDPGPRFGKLIQTIETMRDNGAIKTRKQGLEALHRVLTKKSP